MDPRAAAYSEAEPTLADRPLGPATADDVEAWLDVAQPGDDLVYHAGASLDNRAAGVVRAGELLESGEVLMFQKRRSDGRGYNYFIRRRKRLDRPPLSAAALKEAGEPYLDADEILANVMRILRRAASFDRQCPTNAEIARLAKLKDGASASYQVRKLRDLGRIEIDTVTSGPHANYRVVTICQSGRRTLAVGL